MMLSWLVESAIKISNIDSNSRYKLNFAVGAGTCDPKYRTYNEIGLKGADFSEQKTVYI